MPYAAFPRHCPAPACPPPACPPPPPHICQVGEQLADQLVTYLGPDAQFLVRLQPVLVADHQVRQALSQAVQVLVWRAGRGGEARGRVITRSARRLARQYRSWCVGQAGEVRRGGSEGASIHPNPRPLPHQILGPFPTKRGS